MQEVVHLVVGEIQGASRYKWPALASAWAICLLGWLVVMALPSVYESSARVYVDTRTALSPVIQGLAIQQDVGAQLNLVQQSLLSEAQIARIIDEAGLAEGATTEAELGAVIEKLRDRVSVSVEPSGVRDQPGGSIFLGHLPGPGSRAQPEGRGLAAERVHREHDGRQAVKFRASPDVPGRAASG